MSAAHDLSLSLSCVRTRVRGLARRLASRGVYSFSESGASRYALYFWADAALPLQLSPPGDRKGAALFDFSEGYSRRALALLLSLDLRMLFAIGMRDAW